LVLFSELPTHYTPIAFVVDAKSESNMILLPSSIKLLRLRTQVRGLTSLKTITQLELYPSSSPFGELPPNLQLLSVATSDNVPLRLDELCPNLVHLTFSWGSSPIVDNLPESLIYLKIEQIHTQITFLPHLPNLMHLVLNVSFSNMVDFNWLPNNLTHLTLSGNFNFCVDNLPQNIKCLVLSNSFNLPIDHLPKSVTHLFLGSLFNCAVDYLPNSMQHVAFGFCFNKNVDNLPPHLTEITFGNAFHQQVDNLPISIQKLVFGDSFNKCVDCLPPVLLHLQFGKKFNQLVDYLPPKLISLKFGMGFNCRIDHLPPSLQKLTMGYSFNKPVDFLPISLFYFRVGYKFNEPMDYLPSNLNTLRLDSHFYLHSLYYIPPTLQNIYITSRILQLRLTLALQSYHHVTIHGCIL